MLQYQSQQRLFKDTALAYMAALEHKLQAETFLLEINQLTVKAMHVHVVTH
jgi:hypothetical protein